MTGRPIHWREYLIEMWALGMFMVSAAVFASLFFHPGSPLAAQIHDEVLRRVLMGLAMGLTAIAIIYSPWGRRSGAHMNPAITLTFYRLGKVAPADLAGYLSGQFAGGVAGIAAVAMVLPAAVADPSVNYVTTVPGPLGLWPAFAAETLISFVMMLSVLVVSSHSRLSPHTGLVAGLLVWAFIAIESPVSGMSMNPARTLGSSLLAWDFTGLWIYFTAPPLGMAAAAEVFVRRAGIHRVMCAKLQHGSGACVFGCTPLRAHEIEQEDKRSRELSWAP
jgi:aquaporin Z